MIIDGRSIASDILAAVKGSLERPLVVRAVTSAPSAATESYLRVKAARAADAGMTLEIVRLPDTATTQDLIAAVRAPGADAVIVQLPLPDHIDTEAVLDSIPLASDADVLSTSAREAFSSAADDALLPPVVDAVREILARSDVAVAGKRAVVIGAGALVGRPAALWLRAQGADVTVLTAATEPETFAASLRSADLIISGAGTPHLIRPEHLAEGVVLIDAGTSEQGGALAGDADPACAPRCAVFTPVPGGVGPVAVACLFRNAARLAARG